MEAEMTSRELRELFAAIAAVKTPRECKIFMRDLCTFAELKNMAERWQVAKQLKQGIPYRTIATNTSSSTATITRVAHWLHHGMGGYKLILARFGHRPQAEH